MNQDKENECEQVLFNDIANEKYKSLADDE